MSYIYLITEYDERYPVLTATTKEITENLLNEYMGLSNDPDVEYLGFFPYDNGYYHTLEGCYKYKTQDGEQSFRRYCLYVDQLI